MISSGTTAFVADVAAVNAGGERRDVLLQSADDVGASARDSGASADLPGRAWRCVCRLSFALKQPRAHSRLVKGVL